MDSYQSSMSDERPAVLETKIEMVKTIVESKFDSLQAVMETKFAQDQQSNQRVEHGLTILAKDFSATKLEVNSLRERVQMIEQVNRRISHSLEPLDRWLDRMESHEKRLRKIENQHHLRETLLWVGLVCTTIISLFSVYNLIFN